MNHPQILKRTGIIVDFDPLRIETAIKKAVQNTPDHGISLPNFAETITNDVVEELEDQFFFEGKIPTVEDIQNIVEEKLVESGSFAVARVYILYRAERAKSRAERRLKELEKIDKELLKVVKHDGKKQKFSRKKLEKVWKIAARGLEDKCPFEELFELFKITLIDGIETQQIMKNLRKAALDKITVENIWWQNIAGRLYVMDFYKRATRSRGISHKEIYTAQAWKAHFDDYIKRGLYSEKFLEHYTDEQILEAGKWLNKERDFDYIYSTLLAFDRRYLLNRNKEIRELPQEMYLAVALFLAIPEKPEERMKIAREIYEATSSQKLSLPTPTLMNARTRFHQLSSCFKLNADDDLRSIYHNIENMAQISKFGGGVGIYLGHIRSRGAKIRGVEGASGGVIPWVRVINDTACAVNQLGARLGAISPTLDIWHKDIYDFLNIQTETGDIRTKAFDVFPAISVPDIFMRRAENNEKFTLFDPHEVETITGKRLEDFFNEEFEKFYLECEKNPDLKLKEEVNAKELMKEFMKSAVETGMPYVFFRDTVNRVNANKHTGSVYATQLCTEICQNTSPSTFITETNEDGTLSIKYKMGDTVVCNLASVNLAKVNQDEDIKQISDIAMRVLDNVITLNFYPIKEAEKTAKKYRSVGLGFMGLAEYLACNGYQYDKPDAREQVDKLFEKFAYHGLRASNELAKIRGKYELFDGSEWSKGIIMGKDKEWFQKNSKTKLEWSNLIDEIQKNGLRFAYHFAPAPNTSTSGVVGTTAGLLPIYKKFFVETNVIAPTVTVAPNLNQENFWLYKEYPHLNMKDVIDMIATVYKWIDQSISFEWMLNPAETTPADLYNNYFHAWRSGIKTIYYLRSMSGEIKEDCISCSG